MKQITFKQYRSIDIVILCFLTAVFESIVCMATNKWFVLQAMAVSITLTMTCIAAFRWNELAIFPCLVGSLSYGIVSKATLQQIIVYCTGSLFCLIPILLLNRLNKEKIKKDFIKRTAFVATVYIFTALGRWILSLIFEQNIGALIVFITSDILSLLFAIIVLTIVKNVDGLLEDQKSYLLRLEREKQEEEKANASDPFTTAR